MAFICQICPPPHTFDLVEGEDGDFSALFLIGHDDARPVTYFAVATLSPYDEDCPEFSFSIVERDVGTGEPTFHESGAKTRNLFSPVERRLVLSVVLAATFALLRWRQPKKVYRCTMDPNPSPRAMLKHDLVSWVFEQAGYTVTRCDQWYGQVIWMAELDDAALQDDDPMIRITD
jgi:hypothetical protein